MAIRTERNKNLDIKNFFEIKNGIVDIIGNRQFINELKALPRDSTSVDITEGNILRLDMCSYKIYQRTDLWWILMFYNDISSPFEYARVARKVYGPDYNAFIDFISIHGQRLKKGVK